MEGTSSCVLGHGQTSALSPCSFSQAAAETQAAGTDCCQHAACRQTSQNTEGPRLLFLLSLQAGLLNLSCRQILTPQGAHTGNHQLSGPAFSTVAEKDSTQTLTFSLSVSRAEVASSRSKMRGRLTRARAMAMRCFCPPDS